MTLRKVTYYFPATSPTPLDRDVGRVTLLGENMRGTSTFVAASTALISLSTPHAFAAQAQAVSGCAAAAADCAVVTTSAGIAVYAPGFFTSFAPTTALDMVVRVPGYSLSNGDQNRRGLGDSFGNLLINGERPSNKSLSLETVLQRISVDDVERIELIQEALPQYEMRGHPRLVNVILREGVGNSGSWVVNTRQSGGHNITPFANFSYTMQAGDAEITFGVEAGWVRHRIRRRESLYESGGLDLTELRFDNDQRHYQEATPTLSINWPLTERATLRFDGRYNTWEWRRNQRSFVESPSGADLRSEFGETDNNGRLYSSTTTLNFDVSDALSIETIALVTREEWSDGPETYNIFDSDGAFDFGMLFSAMGEYEETAFRSSANWDLADNHAVTFGAETALNARDTTLMIWEDRNDGLGYVPVNLDVSDTRVEETRSEIFATHTWTVSDRLSLESGLRYEFSEIEQTGDANQSRSFTYAKPAFTVNWRQDDENRFRFTVERDVDQLNFSKFSSSVDVGDNTSTIGNPDYVPERTWTLEAEWERRFGDGSYSLVIGHDWVEDLDGFIPVTTSDGFVFDAPGNIGDGTNLRITHNLTAPLDEFGLSNAVIDVFLEWYNTSVDDPLTGEARPWSGYREWELRLDYRQSFPEAQFSWGWDYFWLSHGEVYRAREFRRQDFTDGDLDVYVETTRWWDLTMRAGIDAVFNNGDDRERIFYDGSRADGVINAIEYRNESMGITPYFRVRGTF